MTAAPISPGWIALHSNQSERLADVLTGWLRERPLAPLESEVVLVQSNGMAEWIKIAMAQQSGVCAAAQVELPSRFMWRTARQVLGPEQVPRESPLDKLPLSWRLMGVLPNCLDDTVFAPVRGFLQGDEPDRLLQLASRLADLFDQYQIYRPDWLQDWAAGRDVCRQNGGLLAPVAAEQAWQPALWRRVLDTLDERQRSATRPAVHQRVLQHLRSGAQPAQPVARRVSLFGMSHMPLQLLELLEALSGHSQVLLSVPNPCRYHWGEIMDGREWLRSERQRHRDKVQALGDVGLAQMHLHAPTLLAAWGRQGRDFVRMLDAFDDAQATRERLQLPTLDFFDDAPIEAGTSLLAQLQRRIRDLVPSTADAPAQPLLATDATVLFRTAHSPVRELEVLHDQLLDWFASPPGGGSLSPREVVVMVPDIERMAPAIEAVFGQYPRSDVRHISYAIADLGSQASSPLIHAVQWLLALPQERAHMSELVALLEVPALARRFGVSEDSLPLLTRWMSGSGIRWGLSAPHREGLGLQACGEVNSALFGVQRMLMGYACGADPVPLDAAVMPYDEVGGLDAELAGSLAELLQVLMDWWQQVQTPATPAQWGQRARALLVRCFDARTDAERQALQALEQALDDWLLACEGAGFAQTLPLPVARQAWLQALRVPQLQQRFRAGGVTFCTLMPMRAIPFKVVCLLGMNDGDYPRRAPQADFDLMAQSGMARPGDRSRQSDDRQLMLEALLSARNTLYVSWCDRSVRDDSEQPPSVLVAQLRDEIDLLWGKGTAKGLTVAHPLQPFGKAYFTQGSGLSTYAHEWQMTARSPLGAAAHREEFPTIPVAATEVPVITLAQLARFLRRPVGAFFRERLQVHLDALEAGWLDDELFGLAGLDQYSLLDEALSQLPPGLTAEGVPAHAQAVVQRLRASGQLPLAGVGQLEADKLQSLLQALLQTGLAERAGHTPEAPRIALDCTAQHADAGPVRLLDTVSGLWRSPSPAEPPLLVLLRASSLATVNKKNEAQPLPDKLIEPWLLSLAAAAMGQPLRIAVVGRNALVRVSPLPQGEAQAQLQALLQLWAQGMSRPLPLPPALALKYLDKPEDHDSLRKAYEEARRGLQPMVRQDAALYRCYPTLADLLQDGRFEALAEPVYGPLRLWAQQCTAQVLQDPVPEAEDGEGA